MWAYVVALYVDLPNEIPTHFNHLGEVDRYDSKGHIIVLCGIGTAPFLGMPGSTANHMY
jgi:uncharacterized membrane protein